MTERVRIVKEVDGLVENLRKQLENGNEICRDKEGNYLIGPYKLDSKVKKLYKEASNTEPEWTAKFADAMGQYLEEIVPLIRICLNETKQEERLRQIARIEYLVKVKLDNAKKIDFFCEISCIRGKIYFEPFPEIIKTFQKIVNKWKAYENGEEYEEKQDETVKCNMQPEAQEEQRELLWDDIQNTVTNNYSEAFPELLEKIQELLRTWKLILGWT